MGRPYSISEKGRKIKRRKKLKINQIFSFRGEGKGGKYLEKENIILAEEKEKEEDNWRRKTLFAEKKRQRNKIFGKRKHFFAEKKKDGERKGGKYLEK